MSTKIYSPFRIRKAKDGYYFQYVAKNGKEVMRSSETYLRKASCIKSIKGIWINITEGLDPFDVPAFIDETI